MNIDTIRELVAEWVRQEAAMGDTRSKLAEMEEHLRAMDARHSLLCKLAEYMARWLGAKINWSEGTVTI